MERKKRNEQYLLAPYRFRRRRCNMLLFIIIRSSKFAWQFGSVYLSRQDLPQMSSHSSRLLASSPPLISSPLLLLRSSSSQSPLPSSPLLSTPSAPLISIPFPSLLSSPLLSSPLISVPLLSSPLLSSSLLSSLPFPYRRSPSLHFHHP